jgi:hypothetical protein
LAVVATDDDRFWSVFDAARMLGSDDDSGGLSEEKVRNLIKLAGLQPAGKRHNGSRRRHVRVYRAVDLIHAYEKIATLTS